MHFCDITYWLQ